MDPERTYEILRSLASPLVALTMRRGEKLNGMIANSAIRASLVPGAQRVAVYVFKEHLSHEILAETGRYVLHLLSRDQWDEIRALGFRSGREAEKLEGLDFRLTEDGLPVLPGSVAWLRCRVVNVMDAGASTYFMGDVLEAGEGAGQELMDSGYFREHMPAAWRESYRENLRRVQELAAGRQDELDDRAWREMQARHTGRGSAES